MIYTDNWVQNNFDYKDITVKINDVIKLKNPLGEAFWVIVKDFKGRKIIGRVNNHLIFNSEYNYDDFVSFSKKDIRDYKDEEIQRLQRIDLETNNIMQSIIQTLVDRGVFEAAKKELGRDLTLDEVVEMIDYYLTR